VIIRLRQVGSAIAVAALSRMDSGQAGAKECRASLIAWGRKFTKGKAP
jgi:hypothetical protein